MQAVNTSLDPGFGKNGKVATKFPGGFSEARAVVVQTDGKIVVAGSNAGSGNSDFALARYNQDGRPDFTFGEAGKVATDFSVSSDVAFSLALQPDGKIIAVGAVNNFGFGIARYNTDGSLDSTFGSGGKVTTGFISFAGALAVALQPNGKIVVAGIDLARTDRDFAIARYNSDGSIDSSFGAGGRVLTDFGGNEGAHAIALQPDGKIVAAGGENSFVAQADFELARYNADGSPDSTFGSGGKVSTDFFGGRDLVNSLALQTDGKIVAAGTATKSSPAFSSFYALARYNTNGSLDVTFGSGGLVATDFGVADEAHSVAIQTDGKIIAAGSTSNNVTPTDFGLVRYNTDGSLDSGFGLNGKVTTDFGAGENVNSIALQSDGKIVAVGSSNIGPAADLDFAIARYESNGNLDPGFGSAGKVTTEFFSDSNTANAVAVQSDGKIILAGLTRRKATSGDMALARISSNGTLDPTFGSGGQVVTDFSGSEDAANAIAIQPDGKILAAGFASTPGGGQDFALVRYNANGSLDSGFGAGGKVTTAFFGIGFDEAHAIALQPDGKIILAGRAQVNFDSFAFDFALARYNADGSLDPTFGSGGKVTTDILGASADVANAVVLQPDGKIVAAGGAQRSPSSMTPDFALTRYNADGRLDSGFGSGGKVSTDFFGSFDQASALALQSDGKIVAAGVANPDFTLANSDFALARYNPDGNLDSTFGSGGKVTTDFFSGGDEAKALAVEPNGKLVAAGRTSGLSPSQDFALAFYNTNGSLDLGFGSGGKVSIDFFGSVDGANALALQSDGKLILAGAAIGGIGSEFAVARYEVPSDFALGLDAPEITTQPGTKVRVNVSINRSGGFAGAVTITPPDTSALGIKVTPSDPISTTDESVKFKLKIKAGAQTGTHQLAFIGTDSSGRVRSAVLILTIQ